MYDYAIFNHDRTKIERWLGVISILIAGTISQILIEIYNLTGIEAFVKGNSNARNK